MRLKAEIKNCDVLSRGTATRSFDNTKVIYTADERGVVCDYVGLSDSATTMSYLLRLKGETVEGRPPKIFLWDSGSERNTLEYLLAKGNFDQSFSILPAKDLGSYSLNLEARSFGQRVENRIDSVQMYYLPPQLASTRIEKSENAEVANALQIESVKKTGTWLYWVKVSGGGLLRLSQGYDKGWLAADLSQMAEHVKVDGWANGFLLRERGTREIVIMFWPQLLEYLGFVILSGVTVGLLRRRSRN